MSFAESRFCDDKSFVLLLLNGTVQVNPSISVSSRGLYIEVSK